MITVVVGKEIERLKGEFESVINGMNMVGEIPYNVYSELFDTGTDCIQKAYALGKSELEERIHTLEVYLEGAVNYLILAGDTDNRIISDVETILHMTFNKSPNVPNVFQKLTKAKEIIKKYLAIGVGGKITQNYLDVTEESERFLSEVDK